MSTTGFNGAAADQPRKSAFDEHSVQTLMASMEPRLISRGNSPAPNSLVVKDLQARLRAVAARFTSDACPARPL